MNDDLRAKFPLISNSQIAYLDSAATAQKPKIVSDTMYEFLTKENATVHRGVYGLSQRATDRYDAVRESVRRFLNAKSTREIVFVRGTTEAINLVANGLGKAYFKPGDEILISEVEHHANFVPWQQLANSNGLVLKTIPVNDIGELDMTAFEALLTTNVKLVAIAHISNVLGSIFPVNEIIKKAHAVGAKVLIDGAQAVSHMPVDVQALDCDFYCFSGHKLYGPTGIGVLYGKEEIMTKMPPYQFGGDMIESVTLEETTFAPLPEKFEAGTPAVVEVLGLGAAIDFVTEIGFDRIHAHEMDLLLYATAALKQNPRVDIIGEARNKASVISFILEDVHPHDIGTILDDKGIAIRAGHHCSQPAMLRFGVSATARASFAIYNTRDEVDRLIDGINFVLEVMT
ncbi:MAG: cysteine desulfurase [bacterium]|nr:cysteine desulfurase [bacterium]